MTNEYKRKLITFKDNTSSKILELVRDETANKLRMRECINFINRQGANNDIYYRTEKEFAGQIARSGIETNIRKAFDLIYEKRRPRG